MCGIWAYISSQKELRDYYNYFQKIKHRGPDASIYTQINNVAIGFHRLSILERSFNGNQPYMIDNTIFICNGEIYNYEDLIKEYNLKINNHADCLTILHLYKNLPEDEFLNVLKNKIKAEYAFMIFDFDENHQLKKIIASRDHVGVRPLYYGYNDDEMFFSSELKGIPIDFEPKEFPCGNLFIYDYKKKESTYLDYTTIYDTVEVEDDYKNYLNNIKDSLTEAVKRRLIADDDVEIGFYLSGGLDSSLLCSIASKLLYPKRIRTFAIGFKESTDLPYAKMVAEYINSDHTEIIIDENDALKIIDDVIYATCTYDVTTIRASCGQYLISKYIKENTNIRVIINGDGSDEVCGGYIFNYNAPSPKDFHDACKKYVKEIHMYDGRRLDRTLSYFSLEARVPFLDIDFIKSYWNIPANLRMPVYKNVEKYLLREAFDDYKHLPKECLFRKKEAFSDGISSKKKSWFKTIQDMISELELNPSDYDAPTEEAAYYKKVFIKRFGKNKLNIIPAYWQPAFQNNSGYIDPSARILDAY